MLTACYSMLVCMPLEPVVMDRNANFLTLIEIADTPGRPIVPSTQSLEFSALSKGKVLLVVSPDYPELMIKLFEREGFQNSDVVISHDMPSKTGGIYLSGALFRFKHAGTDKMYGIFSFKDYSTVSFYLKERLKGNAQQ